MDDFNFCTDCKTNTEVVFDHTSGDTICSECGLVLEARTVDDTMEWRTFSDDNNDHDPNRVGQAVNLLLNPTVHLSTVIKPANGSKEVCALSRIQNRGGDPDRAIVTAIREISNIAERLGLVSIITNRANELYKKLEDRKCTRGRNLNALAAGCIFIACRLEGKTRTVKELCSAVSGVSKKELGRANTFIERQLKNNMGGEDIKTADPEVYLKRFCSGLGMNHEEVKVVKETLENANDFDIRRNPTSIVAAVIYMITQLSDSKKPMRDIAVVTTVAEGTIKNTYRDLYPHAAKIIPEHYAKNRDLNLLSRPKDAN